ncbi:MAG: sigma-54-dependent Fis family transcriptional regulator [Desulfobacteraceae bacterium]|nr:MAG: sigma-54-dependent Fis family transcriptional regulator [Desulfobacteraceae bacterium]
MKDVRSHDRQILLVDDEVQALKSFEVTLRTCGIKNILSCRDSREVIPLLTRHEIEAVLLDLNMPHLSGEELLERIACDFPEIPVIIITANDTVDSAVECMKAKAFDYMVKPVEKSRLVSGVRRAIEIRRLEDENCRLKERLLTGRLAHPEAFSEIVTGSKIMGSLFQYVESIASSLLPVLITGETGTGKELMARAIHNLSGRKGGFVAVNVAGLDDNAFTDTLFGHAKGAFTGADRERKGLVENASGGSLLLDEIGDLNLNSQIKLLRLIQEQEYFPIGSDNQKRSDVRIIAATNLALQQQVKSGAFRKDLYYRLKGHHIEIPPLRKRMDDLPLLVDHFIAEASKSLGKKKPSYPKELLTLLSNHHFPGNMRELRTMIYDAVGCHSSKILSLDRFKSRLRQERPLYEKAAPVSGRHDADFMGSESLPTLREASRLLITEAMKRTENNQSIAADLLGITRQTLNRHLKEIAPEKTDGNSNNFSG